MTNNVPSFLNILNIFRDTTENILWIVIFIIAVIFIIFIVIFRLGHNWKIKNKFRIEKIGRDKNFEIKKLKNDDRIYIINKEEKIAHHVVNLYTLNELGFHPEDTTKIDKKMLKKYKNIKRIKIYHLIVGIKETLILATKIKKLVI